MASSRVKLLMLILRNTEWKIRGSIVELSFFEVKRRVLRAERGRYEKIMEWMSWGRSARLACAFGCIVDSVE